MEKRVEKLEAELEELRKSKKDMSNSSIPSSENRFEKKYPKREKSNLKVGGQKGHVGVNKAYSKEPTEIINLDSYVCPSCGCEHFIETEEKTKRKQVIDFEIKPVITEYRQHHRICAKCGKRLPNKEFISNGNVVYGNNVKRTIGYLNIQHHCSYARIPQIIKTLFGINISKGSVDNILKELATNLKDKYTSIIEYLKLSDVLGSDETTMRLNSNNSYLWAFQNNKATYFIGNQKRNYKKIQ